MLCYLLYIYKCLTQNPCVLFSCNSNCCAGCFLESLIQLEREWSEHAWFSCSCVHQTWSRSKQMWNTFSHASDVSLLQFILKSSLYLSYLMYCLYYICQLSSLLQIVKRLTFRKKSGCFCVLKWGLFFLYVKFRIFERL